MFIIEFLESKEDRDAFMTDLPDFIAPIPDEPLPEPIRGAITLGIIRNEEDDL